MNWDRAGFAIVGIGFFCWTITIWTGDWRWWFTGTILFIVGAVVGSQDARNKERGDK